MMYRHLLITLVLIGLLGLTGCREEIQPPVEDPVTRNDLQEIIQRGKLIAATGYGATSYFIYKGRPMGYEYELLERLAAHLDVELEIHIVKDLDTIFTVLDDGQADIIGLGLTVTKDRADRVAFTDHHNVTRQMLVQRLPENWWSLKMHEIDRLLIRSPIDLIGKPVHVWGGSSYHARLINLSEEIGGDIMIMDVPGNLSTEDLIGMVSRGEIEFTVADENIARISRAYYSNIDIRTPLSLPQRTAWAVRKSSSELLSAVNRWTNAMKGQSEYYVIYNKYFKNRAAFRERAKSDYWSLGGGKISPWDEVIKTRAEEIGLDWRLLASLIYQESEFDPHCTSWAGARGLMQLIPETGARFGTRDLYDPMENIAAGTRYLQWLDQFWDQITDPGERIKFVLGSYNAGQGHVKDAVRLARKYGRKPDTWDDNVAYYLLRKSSKKIFNDPVVKHGYCRGEEPCLYVSEILERFEHYRKHWPDVPTPIDPEANSALELAVLPPITR